MFKTMPKQVQQSPEKKRPMEQTRGSDQYTAMRQMASLMGNQAMLGMMQSQGQYQKEQSPFFDDMRKKFGPKQKTESQASPTHQSSGGTSLPNYLREKFEKKSGLPMDDVRVHYNSDKPAELGALAYTQGTDVHIGPGQEEHLEHELVHVVQQKQGMVQPTKAYGNLPVNDSPVLESMANSMRVQNKMGHSAPNCVVQCCKVGEDCDIQTEIPEYLYHGSTSRPQRISNTGGLGPGKKDDQSIPLPGATTRGLGNQNRKPQPSHDFIVLHLTGNFSEALEHAHNGYVYRVRTNGLTKSNLKFEANEWRYTGSVPINATEWIAVSDDEDYDEEELDASIWNSMPESR